MNMAVSHTAVGTSLMRAIHTRTAHNPLINDPWGDQLVPKAASETILRLAVANMSPDERDEALSSPEATLENFLTLGLSDGFANVILRTRYTEDALAAVVANGVRQYVIIGAGFDSFALRSTAAAPDLNVYEIDQPDTQNLKRLGISELGLQLSDTHHFIASDLATEDLGAALARSSYRPDIPAFFSWLGVTMYLSREANFATMRAIVDTAASGSELVFTYFDEVVFESDVASESQLKAQQAAAAVGESFQSRFAPSTLAEDLRGLGLLLVEDMNDCETAESLGVTQAQNLQPHQLHRIARAAITK
jgi:methyltransferase (TIGR00027 family)